MRSNALQVLLALVLPWKAITNGACLEHLCRTALGNSFLSCVSWKSVPLRATSVSSVNASSFSGRRMQRNDAHIASIGDFFSKWIFLSLWTNSCYSGFSHVSIFNQEILNPSKCIRISPLYVSNSYQSRKEIMTLPEKRRWKSCTLSPAESCYDEWKGTILHQWNFLQNGQFESMPVYPYALLISLKCYPS